MPHILLFDLIKLQDITDDDKLNQAFIGHGYGRFKWMGIRHIMKQHEVKRQRLNEIGVIEL